MHFSSHRQDMDLIMTMEIQLVESLCGFQKPVQTLDNRTLLITSHPGECSYLQVCKLHTSHPGLELSTCCDEG